MPDAPDPWGLIGQRIAQRIADLHLLQVEVQRAAGISDKTLSGYIAGKPVVRPDKRRGLCRALGWTDDSITRMVRGDEPELRADEPVSDTDYNSRIARMPEHVRRTIDDIIDGVESRRDGGTP